MIPDKMFIIIFRGEQQLENLKIILLCFNSENELLI